MKGLPSCAIGIALLSPAFVLSQSAVTRDALSAKQELIGAWHLVSMEEQGPDGTMKHIVDRKGQLIYTRDGHMSVQIMFPESDSAVSNDYVLSGYEASFGSYDVDETARTVTHHVKASITRGLVGKDLTRRFQFSNGQLVITSVRPDEHWSVTWQHD